MNPKILGTGTATPSRGIAREKGENNHPPALPVDDYLQKELFESIFPPKNIEDVFRCEILAIILTATEGCVIIINAL